MVMSYIFTILVGAAAVSSLILGNGQLLGQSVLKGAGEGFQLVLSMAGSICLWTGVGKLLEGTGITGCLSRIGSPLLGRIFPSFGKDPAAAGAISSNVCANLLGLGNAATPMGIQAVKALRDPLRPDTATDEICRLVVLNTASIQLIPTNVAALRASFGSAHPLDILPCVWITSLCSAAVGLTAAWILGKLGRWQ